MGRAYPGIVGSWEAELEHLVTYLRYPEETRWLIYTTNPLERFIKEVKRRIRVIEVFPAPDACTRVIYLVTQEVNEKYSKRAVPELVGQRGASVHQEGKYGQARPVPHSYAGRLYIKLLTL